MKTNNFLKDKNKLLMIIPIVLGGLFLYVFFVHDTSSKEVAENEKERQSVLLEPDSEAKDKVLNKIEAYKQDEREEKEKQRIMDESQVRGSDFYFDLQNRNEKYDQATLEKIRKMRRDPYSDVMGEYGSSDSHLSEQLEKQLASIEDEEELKEIIREARKNAEIRKELEQNNVYRQKIYKRIIGYDQEKKKEYESVYLKGIAIGVVLCILAVIPLFMVMAMEAPDYIVTASVSVLLMLVAAGVYLILHVSTVRGGYDMLLQEGDYSLKEKKYKEKINIFSTVYWCTATAIYLGWSFWTQRWDFTWLVWPVAGVMFGAVSAVARVLVKDEK